MTRRLAFVIFPQFQLMDVAGPIAASDFANLVSPGAYQLEFCAPLSGMVRSSSGASFFAEAFGDGPFDTVLVSGGYGLGDEATMSAVAGWLARECPSARRVSSVCVGAYALAGIRRSPSTVMPSFGGTENIGLPLASALASRWRSL